MKFRSKKLTIDCQTCGKMSVDDDGNFICRWGTTPKIMKSHEGKRPLNCKLIRE